MQRTIQALAGACLACSLIAAPARAWAMDARDAVQLLSRTGAGLDPAEMTPLSNLTLDEAVKKMLDGTRTTPTAGPPEWVNGDNLPPQRLQAMTPEERMKYQQQQQMERQDLVAWWYHEMAVTDSPLTEHMTLFWHNHFTSSLQKVNDPVMLYKQNETLRKDALGNFGHMLHAIAKDPAMIRYLDNQTNRRGAPNENFARELMELFTLGEGHYTELDIKESARAFTGWEIDPQTRTFFFNARQHDYGPKSFFGRTGPWNGDDILNMLLEQKQTAIFVTRKLWKDLISATPDDAEVERMAQIFRDSHYEIKPLVQAMLTSKAFRDSANQGTLVKSPAELIVETVRTLQVPVGNGLFMANAGRQMGQTLFDPPNVKGWPGGQAWINSNTLLARRQFLDRVSRGLAAGAAQQGMMPQRPAANAAAAQARAGGAALRVPQLQVPATAQAQTQGQSMAMQNEEQGMEANAADNGAIGSGGVAAAQPQPAIAARGPRGGRGLRGQRGLRGNGQGRGARAALVAQNSPMNKIYQSWTQSGLRDPKELADLLLPVDPVQPPPTAATPAERVQALLLDPVYQLK